MESKINGLTQAPLGTQLSADLDLRSARKVHLDSTTRTDVTLVSLGSDVVCTYRLSIMCH